MKIKNEDRKVEKRLLTEDGGLTTKDSKLKTGGRGMKKAKDRKRRKKKED